MTPSRIGIWVFIYVIFLSCGQVTAGGFQVNLQGQKQSGMGHTGVSLFPDASVMFFNPAGIALLKEQIDIVFGAHAIISRTAFQAPAPQLYESHTDNDVSTPFELYASYKPNDKLGLGVAVYTPFGSGVRWEEGWSGRYLVQEISLQTIFVQPTAAYRISDNLSIGAGLIYAYGNIELSRNLPINFNNGGEASVNLDGSAQGFGFNAGLHLRINDRLGAGLSYRSRINMKVEEGSAKFNVPVALHGSIPSENNFAAELPLPATATVGMDFDLTGELKLSLDVNYVFWEAYDSLVIEFEENGTSLNSRGPRKYENALIYRLGAQWKASERWILRAGAYFDQSPAQDNYFSPETPDMDKLGLTMGLSFMPAEHISIDASFIYLEGFAREADYEPANFPGTYDSRAWIPGIGASFKF